MHVRAARTNGLSVDEIGEVILQAAVYCGVPAANHAFAIAQRVLDEHRGGPPWLRCSCTTPCGRRSAGSAARWPAPGPTTWPPGSSAGCSSATRTSTTSGSARCCSATPTEPARTTATSPGWRCCWPDCRSRCPRRRSTGSAAPPSTPPSPAPGRSRSARPTSSWSAGSSRCRAHRGCCRSRSGRSRPATPSWCRPRSAGGWSTPRCPAPGPSRSARRPSSCATARAGPARTRTRSRCGRTSSRHGRGTAASTTTR